MVEALVVGAGIGGLAAALALRRNGLGVRVFEQASDPRQLGFALLLAPNAMTALRQLGLADEVRAKGMVLRQGEMRRPDGSVLRRFDAARVSAALGEDTVCVLRPVLQGALLGALGSDVIEWGAKVTGFRAADAGVVLEFEKRPAVEGKVLIGADGVGSVIRQRLHPGDPAPRRRGLRAFRGVARNAGQHLGDLSGVQYFGRGLEAGASRANAEDVYWFLCVRSPEASAPSGDVRSQLDPHLVVFHSAFRALVAATRDDELRADDLYERSPLARWGEGAVSLLGDAAHPMLPHAGQGAAQGLEDAVALGQGLRAHRFVEQALRRYEELRIPRTRTIVELARRNARMGSLSGALGCWLRDLAVQRLPERTLLRSMIDLGRPPADPARSDAARDLGPAA